MNLSGKRELPAPSEPRKLAKSDPSQSTDPIVVYFGSLSTSMDAQSELREATIKRSRDITRLSKKVISLLHRCNGNVDSDAAIFAEAEKQIEEIRQIFDGAFAALAPNNIDFWRYYHNLRGGIEEFIEAVSYLVYLRHKRLILPHEAAAAMNSNGVASFQLPLEDYFGGIADLSGELMRLCVSSAGHGRPDVCRESCTFAQQIQCGFARLAAKSYSMSKKMGVMRASVSKMEQVCFKLQLRARETELLGFEPQIDFEQNDDDDGGVRRFERNEDDD